MPALVLIVFSALFASAVRGWFFSGKAVYLQFPLADGWYFIGQVLRDELQAKFAYWGVGRSISITRGLQTALDRPRPAAGSLLRLDQAALDSNAVLAVRIAG